MKDRLRSRKASSAEEAVAELEGYVGLGMQKDALALARQHLESKCISARVFYRALDSILTLADATKPWRPLVEAAYDRLSGSGKRQARPMMLAFYSSVDDPAAAVQFIPRRFVGAFWAVDLMFGMEALVALDRVKDAGPLARKAAAALDDLVEPEGRTMLMSSLATFFAAAKHWETAIELCESLQEDELMSERASFELIRIHLQRAQEAIRTGTSALERLGRTSDPDLETIIPGNDAARRAAALGKLANLEQLIERARSALDSPTGQEGTVPPQK